MTRAEIKEMCALMEVPFDADHPDHINADSFETIEPPFMEYVIDDHSVSADGIRYLDIKQLRITVYSDAEESEAEERIEAVLEERELRWRKEREFIEEVLMWGIYYTLEV